MTVNFLAKCGYYLCINRKLFKISSAFQTLASLNEEGQLQGTQALPLETGQTKVLSDVFKATSFPSPRISNANQPSFPYLLASLFLFSIPILP